MPIRTDLLDPIPGDTPGGPSIRYEPVYDQIRLARTEETKTPVAGAEGKKADYKQVIKLAGDVLATKSKDLQVAAWLTEALLRMEGVAGLRDGLVLLHGMLDRFWDDLHPELEDGDAEMRVGPLEWVGHYLVDAMWRVPLNRRGHDLIAYREARQVGFEADVEDDWDRQQARKALIEEGKLTGEEWEAGFAETPKAWYKQLVAELAGTQAALKALEKLGDEKFGGEAPGYHPLEKILTEVRAVVDGLLAKKLELDPDPPEEVSVEEIGVYEDAEGAEGGAPGGIPAAPRSREDAAARVGAAARWMRAHAPGDPAPFLMLRGLRWGELRAGGGEIDPKLLAAPPTEVRTRLKGLMLDEKWPELLDAAEDVMATPFGRGWLDLQRYVLTATDTLGYDQAGSAVRGAIRSLLADLPNLLEQTLMDDSPTANAETRAWLKQQRLLGPPPAAEAAEDGAPAPARGRSAFDRARDRVRAGQPDKAVEILMREAAQEKSPRARFLRRSQAARIMVDAGMEAVALPVLEEMVQLIEKHGLEEWEAGDTIAQPLGLMYRCLSKLDGDYDTKQSLYLRVCRLDPMLGMQLTSGSSGAVPDDGDTGY